MSSPRAPHPAALEARLRQVRLHQLEGFFHVGLHEGFTRAAEAMPWPISEPALHQQVRKLERALGVPLVVRGPGRRMLLTPEGKQVHAFVAGYFRGLPGLLREVAGGAGGELTLGCEPLLLDLAASGLAALRARAPQVRLRLSEGDAAELAARVASGALDAALSGELEPGPGVSFVELGRLGLELVLPAGHPLASRRRLSARDLDGLEVAGYVEGTAARRFADETLALAQVRVSVVAEAGSAAALRALARAGVAPACVPALTPTRGRRRTRKGAEPLTHDLAPLLPGGRALPRYGVFRRAAAPSPLQAALLRALHAPASPPQ